MKTVIEKIAENFFAPRLTQPEQLIWNHDDPDAQIQSIKTLDYPGLTNITVGGKNWSTSWTVVVTKLSVTRGQTLKKGDVIGIHKGSLAPQLQLVKKTFDDRERAQLLLEIIKYWAGNDNITFFCEGEGAIHKFDWKKWSSNPGQDETPLGWKYPSSCSSCVKTLEILSAIFPSLDICRAPFTVSRGDRRYSLNLRKLIVFIEKGAQGLHDEAKRLAEEKVRQERLQHEQYVNEALDSLTVSEVNRQALIAFCEGEGLWSGLTVVSPDLVIAHGERHSYGGSGGVAMYSDVRVWYKGQVAHKEWQWRDSRSASNDRPNLFINGIGHVKTKTKDGNVEINIELLNRNGGNRHTTFTFTEVEAVIPVTLSVADQAAFKVAFEKETERVLGRLNKMWELKPPMTNTPSGHPTAYYHPQIKERMVNAPQGVAAFITEEQVDHMSDQRQLSRELYVMKTADTTAKRLHQVSGSYAKGGGNVILSLIEVTSEKVVIGTLDGQQAITLS